MQHSTYAWKQQAGQSIFAQRWTGTDTPRGIMLVIHGQSDHSNRFVTLATHFAASGYAVYAADLIGHGQSGGNRGHMLRFEEYLETVDALLDLATQEFPGLPVFLYGQSMGGNVVINYAFRQNGKVQAYIASSPWIRLAFEPPAWKVWLGKTVKSIYPALAQPTGLNTKHLARDPEIVRTYEQDPLVHGKITASAFFETLQAGLRIPEQATKLDRPMLIMHGTGDQLTSHRASQAFAALRTDLITFIPFEGWYHELHNEPEKQIIFDTIARFMQKQISNG